MLRYDSERNLFHPTRDDDDPYAMPSNFSFILFKLLPLIKWLKLCRPTMRLYFHDVPFLRNWYYCHSDIMPRYPSGEEYAVIGFYDNEHKEFKYRLDWEDEKPTLLRPNEAVQTRAYWTAKDLLPICEAALRRRLAYCDTECLDLLREYLPQ